MNIVTAVLPGRVVDALGWTLFHSLWQGALAALAFAAVLYVSRRYSARVRYALGLAALLLVLAASVITFFSYYTDHGPGVTATFAATATTTADETAPATLTASAAAQGGHSTAARIAFFFSDYFGRNLPLFVTLWLLGVLFLTLRFTGGMLYLQRLKYKQNRPLPPPWPERLRRLAEKAGLQRPLPLLESLRLRTPVVIGHLKPVLLLPAGLVSGLPADEVEALLAHELAHVMRRDYLVNLLQNLVEILYFFHPGVRWISAGVRQEREHCCDDFAVDLCGDAQNYARALARLQVSGASFPEPALAAVGRPQRLLRRIVRLLGAPRLGHDFREGFVSALLLVLGLLGMLRLAQASVAGVPAGESGAAVVRATASRDVPAPPAPPAPPSSVSMTTPAAPAPPAPPAPPARFVTVSFDLEAAGKVKLIGERVVESGAPESTWLVADNSGQVVWYMDLSSKARPGIKASFSEEVPLAAGAYTWYRPAGWKVTAQWKRAGGQNGWQPLTMFVGMRGNVDSRLGWSEDDHRLKELELKEMAHEQERARIEHDLQKARESAVKLEEQEQKKLEQEQLTELDRLKAQEMRLKAEQERMHEMLKQQEMQTKADLAKAEERLKEEQRRLKDEEQRLKKIEENFRKFTAALEAEGLIRRGKGYEVRLSLDSLTIDGKKQPRAVLEKVLQLYEKIIGSTLGKGTFIINGD
jgi:bla regulator protein BlaR1